MNKLVKACATNNQPIFAFYLCMVSVSYLEH